jgi:hypothetical protein
MQSSPTPCLTRRVFSGGISIGERLARYGWLWSLVVVGAGAWTAWWVTGGILSIALGAGAGLLVSLALFYYELLYMVPGVVGVVVLWGVASGASVVDIFLLRRRLIASENRIALVVLGVNTLLAAAFAYIYVAHG